MAGELAGAGLLGLLALATAYGYVDQRSRVEALTETAVSTTAALVEGQVAVEGTVATGEAAPLSAPLSGDPAVVVEWAVEEGDEDSAAGASGTATVPFVVEDGHGRVRVDPATPESATLAVTTEVHQRDRPLDGDRLARVEVFDTDDRPAVWRDSSAQMSHDLRRTADRRLVERTLAPGDRVSVLGEATADGDGTFTLRRGDGPFLLGDRDLSALADRLGSDSRWLAAVAAGATLGAGYLLAAGTGLL